VDSGSTHSFISLETASHLHLQPDYRPGIQVTVANVDRVASTGICRGIHIFIDKEEFVLDFFVIPLAGYEMVLGVHWLCMLGLILWDFGRAQMSCWRDDHRVVWQGVTTCRTMPTVQAAVTKDLMEALLDEFADVFSISMGLPPSRLITIESIFCPAQHRSQYGPTGNLSWSRMNWRDNVLRCCSRGLFDRVRQPSPRRFCLSRNKTGHGASVWTIAP
jgi:hypothetical protein